MFPATGILHPGEMGSCIAHSLQRTVGQVYWCSQDRSDATRVRADKLGLRELAGLESFCSECELIFSVCPPAAAVDMARAVMDRGFKGIYVDANAIAPTTARSIAAFMTQAGIDFVDGGIIGLPEYKPGSTWLYLSGGKAERVQACFRDGPVETAVIGSDPGQASAVKMCYAAWNKGKNALLSAVLAAAEHMQVREALQTQLDIFDPGFSDQATGRLRNVARKAWRFSAEMEEIAATLQDCGVPHEFFIAAAELYRRESSFKDMYDPPALEEILKSIVLLPR